MAWIFQKCWPFGAHHGHTPGEGGASPCQMGLTVALDSIGLIYHYTSLELFGCKDCPSVSKLLENVWMGGASRRVVVGRVTPKVALGINFCKLIVS